MGQLLHFPHRLATPASHATRSHVPSDGWPSNSCGHEALRVTPTAGCPTAPARGGEESAGLTWHPLDYVEPYRIARANREPIDLYGSFRFEDEPKPSEWVNLARGAAVGLLCVLGALVVLWLSGCSA